MELNGGFCSFRCHKVKLKDFYMRNVILSIMLSLLLLPGCGSMRNMSSEDRVGFGAQVGSFIGWLFGGLIGEAINDENGGEIGAFIGTAVGGVAGASIAASTEEETHIVRRSPKYTPSSHVLLPDLQIEDILLDEDSITYNQKIDAGETCRISFVIVNNSFQDALNVLPVVKLEEGETWNYPNLSGLPGLPMILPSLTKSQYMLLPNYKQAQSFSVYAWKRDAAMARRRKHLPLKPWVKSEIYHVPVILFSIFEIV